ncbi:TNT domain-containing protein [Mesorhizobium sp. B2-3-4]|uniref:TNT domain-containing protein n=1 Tax=Mesorhizobium sp. B2-3-4 TaxID=2589959 RepID=UPI0015E276C8|nr:TNT domain-containing protein [Mesorhizobium sp. B2-3-4]
MVHVIPLSIAKRGRDRAAQHPQGSSADGTTRGYDGDLQELAEHYRQMTERQEAFDAELARRKFNGQIAQAEDEVTANAPADGAGLHEAMYGQVNPYDGRMVKTGLFDKLFAAALPNMPESQRAAFAGQKEAMRRTGGLRMAARQLQRRKDYEQAEVDTALKTSAIAIGNADPDDHVTFEAARQEGLDLIDRMGVDPGIRQQMAKDWFGTAAKARFEALIARDPQRALDMFGVGTLAADGKATAESAQTQGDSLPGGSKVAAGKSDRVGTQTPDERIAQAFRDDLPQQEQDALSLKAKLAKFTQDIATRVAISRAEAEAPDEIARTGAYSGSMPGRDAYRTIYGLDEGDRRLKDLEWQVNVNKQIFDMGTMPNQAVNATLLDATSQSSGSQEDNPHRLATAVAAMRILTARRTDAWGSVAQSVPAMATAWKAVIGGGLEDPNGYNKEAYDKAIAIGLVAQERLGIENPQLVPQYVIQELSDNRNSPSTYQQEKNAKITALLAETSGPVARAAVGRQLAAAGLGWILPVEAGYQPPSTSSIFASEAKALGKLAANAGIFLGKVSDQMGSNLASLGGASVKSPENKDVYYEPANDVEDLMMHQGSDAATWGLGEGAGRGIARAIEWLGSKAAGQAGRSVSGLEATNTPTSRVAPGQAAESLAVPIAKAGTKPEISTGTSLYTYYPPNNGFLKMPEDGLLPVGDLVDRFGDTFGRYVAPAGTPVWMRSLVPGTVESKPYNLYEVMKPLPALKGTAAPWFNQGGGGPQYMFYISVEDLIRLGYLKWRK